MFDLDLIFLASLGIIFLASSVLVVFLSDKSRIYQLLSISILAVAYLLEFPHFLAPDPYLIIDVAVHVVAGLGVFLALTNIIKIDKPWRGYIALIITFGIIVTVEIFLSVLEIMRTYINPIGINSIIDIITFTFGGIVGYPLYLYVDKQITIKKPKIPEFQSSSG